MNVADADPVLKYLRHALLGNPDAVILDGNDQAAILQFGADGEFAAAEFRGQAMLQRVFHDGLQEHAGDERIERMVVNLFVYHEIVSPEPRDFDIQIVVDKIEFFLQGHKRFMFAQQPPQNIAQLEDYAARHIRIVANQRGHRIERVK
jgi:hypothetical protein